MIYNLLDAWIPQYIRVVAKLERVVRWRVACTGQHRWSRSSLGDKAIMDNVVNNLAKWVCAWYCLLFSMLIGREILYTGLKRLVKTWGGDTNKLHSELSLIIPEKFQWSLGRWNCEKTVWGNYTCLNLSVNHWQVILGALKWWNINIVFKL